MFLISGQRCRNEWHHSWAGEQTGTAMEGWRAAVGRQGRDGLCGEFYTGQPIGDGRSALAHRRWRAKHPQAKCARHMKPHRAWRGGGGRLKGARKRPHWSGGTRPGRLRRKSACEATLRAPPSRCSLSGLAAALQQKPTARPRRRMGSVAIACRYSRRGGAGVVASAGDRYNIASRAAHEGPRRAVFYSRGPRFEGRYSECNSPA